MATLIRIRATRVMPRCWLVSLLVNDCIAVTLDAPSYSEGTQQVVKEFRKTRTLHRTARRIHQ